MTVRESTNAATKVASSKATIDIQREDEAKSAHLLSKKNIAPPSCQLHLQSIYDYGNDYKAGNERRNGVIEQCAQLGIHMVRG